jgi:lipopolysaccharide transport system ATP-binding protein
MVVRLAFSIAVHVDAEVLVVDEALSVGDVAFQFKCLHHLESLLERGVTILLVSHDVQLVKGYCTRALYLKNNTMEYYGDCETATEMYLKDMRVQKTQMLAEAQAEAAAQPQMPRLHADKGEILSAKMGCGAEDRTQFYAGERVWVDVTARVSRLVRRPRLTLFIRDLKGYGLFGFNNHYANVSIHPDSDGHLRGRFSFNCALQQGDYSIALRLEECMGDTLTLLIDKHLNAHNFKVVSDAKSFLGVVDLGGAFEELPSPRTMATIV